MGVPMAPEKKTVGPSFVLSFAGIELDTNKMEGRLPEKKLAKCCSLIREFLTKKKVTLTELQSLNCLLIPYQTSCILKLILNCFECILMVKHYFEAIEGYFCCIL